MHIVFYERYSSVCVPATRLQAPQRAWLRSRPRESQRPRPLRAPPPQRPQWWRPQPRGRPPPCSQQARPKERSWSF